jgi:ribosomal protein L11 methyltransferase
LRRVAVEVGHDRAEEARAVMLELFPEGFEEVDRTNGVELAAYTDAAGEERIWAFFGGVRAAEVEGGWEERWRAFHRPVRVGRLWIGPPWDEPDADALPVVVDPGRAFGTGSHATTRLCLEALQELAPAALLDVGCGSGVLSIAGALLGYRPVTAVDIEEPSVAATRANAAASGVTLDVRLVALDETLPPAEVVVANISLDAVEGLQARIACETLVTSGYLAADRPRLGGFANVGRRTLDGWACDVHRRA